MSAGSRVGSGDAGRQEAEVVGECSGGELFESRVVGKGVARTHALVAAGGSSPPAVCTTVSRTFIGAGGAPVALDDLRGAIGMKYFWTHRRARVLAGAAVSRGPGQA